MLLGHAYALSGRRQEAEQQLSKLREMEKKKYVPALYTAFTYAGLNDKDQALAWLQKASDERSDYMIYLKVEPSLDNLRSDPRFPQLLRRMGLER